MTLHFCTYFDHRYLPRGLALYHSLARHCADFELHVLCLSETCHRALSRAGLPGIEAIRLGDLEAFDPELAAIRPTRGTVEYYFTTTPALMRYLFARRPDVDLLTYLDADLYFFSAPDEVVGELAAAAVGIVAHRFPPDLAHLASRGTYNVGWVSFRRTADGQACLDWWRERCLEWCYDAVVGGRFADQKYLDQWPDRFAGVVVLRHPGANLAPWNLRSHRLEAGVDGVLVDGRPLVFYHAHGFEFRAANSFETHVEEYGGGSDPLVVENVYAPYARALAQTTSEAAALLAESGPEADGGTAASELNRPLRALHGEAALRPAVSQLARRFVQLDDALLSRVYLTAVTTPAWGIETGSAILYYFTAYADRLRGELDYLWLGDGAANALHLTLFCRGARRLRLRALLAPGSSRTDDARNLRLTVEQPHRGVPTVRYTRVEGAGPVDWELELADGANRVSLAVLDVATVPVQPNGDSRPLLAALCDLHLSDDDTGASG